MAEETFFRHIRDEESQTDFFVSLLAASLSHGPTVLNAIHDDIEFTEAAQVVATQRDGLPRNHSENRRQRTLDWVVQDSDVLVGYESKTGSSEPNEEQLTEELRKLAYNTTDGEPILYVFSDHSNEPFDRPDVEWMSWYDVANRVLDLDPDSDAVRLLQTMFENQNYDGFDGFDEFEQTRAWFSAHDDQIVELAFEVNRKLDVLELYTVGDSHLPHSDTTRSLSVAESYPSKALNQSIFTVPFHPTGEPEYVHRQYDVCLVLPAFRNIVDVCMHINTADRSEVKGFVERNTSELLEIIERQQMQFRTSWNRLNHPERDIQEYESDAEIERVLDEDIGERYWKRLYLGWNVKTDQPASAIVGEIVDKMQELHRLFYEPAAEFDETP